MGDVEPRFVASAQVVDFESVAFLKGVKGMLLNDERQTQTCPSSMPEFDLPST